jgi:hypothetical protein
VTIDMGTMNRYFTTGLVFSCLLACGCGKGNAPIDGPAIDLETALKPGMSPDEVFNLLGKPDRDEVPESYRPQVVREVEYDTLGLSLYFHTEKGLGKIWLSRRWNLKGIQGYRNGDLLMPGDLDFGQSEHQLAVHFQSSIWPEGLLYLDEVELERDGKKLIGGKIRGITLIDSRIHGTWIPRLGDAN